MARLTCQGLLPLPMASGQIVQAGDRQLLKHEGCLRCGFEYLTSTTRCEKVCPNCGHRDSCHD